MGYAVPVWALVGYLEAVHDDVAQAAHDMYSPEKSIADAFHFEVYVGRDIALEALKTYMARRRRRNIPELLKAAEVCRMRPAVQHYVEALA